MNRRNLWVLMAAAALLIAGSAVWMLMVADRAAAPVVIAETADAPEAFAPAMTPAEPVRRTDIPAASARMPEAERAWLEEQGILTNADRPLSQLDADPAVIQMRNAIIDTGVLRRGGPGVDIPEQFRARPDYRQAIVVFEENVGLEHWRRMHDHGLWVENFVPNRALAVSGPHEAIARLHGAEGILHVEPFHPFFKMCDAIQAHLTVETPPPGLRARALSGRYQVLLFGDPEQVLAGAAPPAGESRRLPALDTPGATPETGAFGISGARLRPLPTLHRQAVAEVEIDAADLRELVLADAVKWIEPAPRYETMNDLGRYSTRHAVVRKVRPDLDGTGQIIGLVDTGADTNHPALAGRLIPGGYLFEETKPMFRIPGAPEPLTGGPEDLSSHGTHVLGTILGNGALSATVNSAPGSEGPPYGDRQFSGMATNARYLMIKDFNSFTHAEMAWESWSRGARIGNNSWGDPDSFIYGVGSMYWDALVKDVDWDNIDELPYTALFAAGNSGNGNRQGTGGSLNTISQPGNAKNVITIGALEQKRHADNLTHDPYFSPEVTDTDWQIASFSGRGRTGDRRVKPDLVAPGEYVLSLQSEHADLDSIEAPLFEQRDFNVGNVDTGPRYAFMSGTSRATAFATGAAALLRQEYIQKHGVPPSPAMLKALLVAGARNLHSTAYEWGPKRGSGGLSMNTLTHSGTVSNHYALIGWWQFSNDFIDSLNGTNLFIDPEFPPNPPNIIPPVDFSSFEANIGFGSYGQFMGGSVQFEMDSFAITNMLWHTTNMVRAIEFWIRRSVFDQRDLIRFRTDAPVSPRVYLSHGNVMGYTDPTLPAGILPTIYVNASTLLPIIDDEWSHVVIIPPQPIMATNWTIGPIMADIDNLRFYREVLPPDLIYTHYTNAIGYRIPPPPESVQRMGGLRSETVIHDGWGRLDLSGVFFGPETFDNNEVLYWDAPEKLETGMVWSNEYHVAPGDKKGDLKVTLTWTDVHGTPGTGRALVNNLDLRVIYQPGTPEEVVYLGNLLGRQSWGIASYPITVRRMESGGLRPYSVMPGRIAPVGPELVVYDYDPEAQWRPLRDDRNNVEKVIIRDLLPGHYRIEVRGASVPVPKVNWRDDGDDDPFAPPEIIGQDFALVVTRGVSSAGETMGADAVLTVDRENTPVLAYAVTDSNGRGQIAVRRWYDAHTNRWPEWQRLENKWFHYGNGPFQEVVTGADLGGAHSPGMAFDSSNNLYLAWIQENDAPTVPDSVYLRYLSSEWQGRVSWLGTNRWKPLGLSYQERGISGTNFIEDAVAPIVAVAWDDQPMVAYGQGDRILLKKWSTNSLIWRGLEGSSTGLVAVSSYPLTARMTTDFIGHPVMLWKDIPSGRLRVVRWSGSRWEGVAGGWLGGGTATNAALACDAFGGIAVSWVETDELGIDASIRVARTTVGGAAWRGLGQGTADSRFYPGIFASANGAAIGETSLAYAPDGSLMAAWVVENDAGLPRALLKKWDGIRWGGLSGSAELPGVYDTVGPLDQPRLAAAAGGFPLLAVRGTRTGRDEIHLLRTHQTAIGETVVGPQLPPPPPLLAAANVFSADGAYQLGDIVPIAVQFPTNVTVAGTPILELLIDPANRFAFYASNSAPDTLVFHYTVQVDDLQTGPALEYAGDNALRLNSGAFVVGSDWYFHAALPIPGGPGALSANNTVTIDGTAVMLAVTSPRGQVRPLRGTNYFAPGTAVTAAVLNSPVTVGGTRYVAEGWDGGGDVPVSGGDTNLVFVINADSTIDWLWRSEHLLTTKTNGSGVIALTAGGSPADANAWVEHGVELVFTPTPDAGNRFSHWRVNGVTQTAEPLALTMGAPLAVTGYFLPQPAPAADEDDAGEEGGKPVADAPADPDPDPESGDGDSDLSDPSDPSDPSAPPDPSDPSDSGQSELPDSPPVRALATPRLTIRPIAPAAGVELGWHAETGHVFEVQYRSVQPGDSWNVLTNLPFTNVFMKVHDGSDGAPPGGRVYRVRQLPAE